MTTTYTFDAQIVSDLHKDARGFRPREGWWATWNEAADDRKQVIWDNLLEELRCTMDEEARREAEALARFETRVTETLALGAGDRTTAIRWILQGMDLSETDLAYGADYVCWSLGLSYSQKGLFAEALATMKEAA